MASLDGYQGLIHNRYIQMTPGDFSGLLSQGGKAPSLAPAAPPSSCLIVPEADGTVKVPAMKRTYKNLKLDCLFVLGGNGSTKTANRLSQEGSVHVDRAPRQFTDNDTPGHRHHLGFIPRNRRATPP